MSAAWIAALNDGTALWLGAMIRASWQGGIALALAWLLGLAWRGMAPRFRCWLWRLAYLKLLLALFWAAPVDLPLLPARSPVRIAAPAVPDRAVSLSLPAGHATPPAP